MPGILSGPPKVAQASEAVVGKLGAILAVMENGLASRFELSIVKPMPPL